MKLDEIIGIVVLKCECGQKFVLNTNTIDQGVCAKCKCGKQAYVNRWSTLTVSLIQGQCSEYYDAAIRREFNKPVGEAMPVEEYKRLLADFIISGKVPKIKSEYKKNTSLDTEEPQIRAAYEALRVLGYDKEEAIAKIDVAVKNGWRMEADIINHILSL